MLLDDGMRALGLPASLRQCVVVRDRPAQLASRLPVERLLVDAVALAAVAERQLGQPAAAGAEVEAGGADETAEAGGADGGQVVVDPVAVVASCRGDELVRVDGQGFGKFAALSGFFPTADGWVRTHANYPHHRAALASALGLGEAGDDERSRTQLARVLRRRHADAVERDVTDAGGIAVRVRNAAEWEQLRRGGTSGRTPELTPVLTVSASAHPSDQADASPHSLQAALPESARHTHPVAGGPLHGVRVLDLTRVIAGPVATRTLALLGADVLRIDPPARPELPGQWADNGFGKRSASVDLTTVAGREVLNALVRGADIVVTGYRPGALERFGLDPVALLRERPELVVGTLSAWGSQGVMAGRRGFDSIVQAASGIATLESPDGTSPGALPVQALDHAAGYVLAAGVLTAWRRRLLTGSGGHVSTSLLAMRDALLTGGAETVSAPAVGQVGPDCVAAQADRCTTSASDIGRVTYPRPALPGYADYPPLRRYGHDLAAW